MTADDPNGTKDTLPPPNGAKDAYSAQTRVGTLPEHVLEAMRNREPDALLQKRTKSGMQEAAATSPAAPAAPPSSGVISAPLAPEISPPAIMTPQEGWLVGPAPTPIHPSVLLARPLTPPRISPTMISVRPPAKTNLWRSIAIVAIFALLGALLAAFIEHAHF